MKAPLAGGEGRRAVLAERSPDRGGECDADTCVWWSGSSDSVGMRHGHRLGPAQTIAYRLESSEPLSRFGPDQIALLAKLNHADSAHLARLRRILIPDRWDGDQLLYSPM